MRDQKGREISYMRISVTDRCNLRCRFCMPEGNTFQEKEKLLSYKELIQIVKAVMPLGIHKFRITGGEPLVRDGVVDFIKEIRNLDRENRVYMTTNGVLLEKNLENLTKAGLDGVNINLCSLDTEEYELITGSKEMDTVIKGILAAANYGISTKVNCVSLADWNEEHLINVASLAKENPIDVRFIEMMPIGLGTTFGLITGAQVLSRMEKVYGKSEQVNQVKGNGPAVYVKFRNFMGDIGFINARTCAFCNDCNRIRLTADGWIKLCLNYEAGINIKEELRKSNSIEALSKKIEKAIYTKPAHHNFDGCEVNTYGDNSRYMSQIGG